MGKLDGQVAIVTGATSGIGEAIARRFAHEGARVALAARDAAWGEAVAAELGGAARFFKTDVRHEDQIADLVGATVDAFGALTCVVNSAGGQVHSDLASLTEDIFVDAMRLLLGSVLFTIKHAVPAMQTSGGGSIINVSSIGAHRTGQGGFLYAAAKAAVSHVTHEGAVKLGPHNIRVNAISPGAITTPIFWGGAEIARTLSEEQNTQYQADFDALLARVTPTPRAGRPADVADAALFLASADSSFVNGHDLVVDGGRMWDFNERPGIRL